MHIRRNILYKSATSTHEYIIITPLILIIDVVIGFNQTLHEVSESEQQALISVILLDGILQREATVTVSITENTAKGKKLLQSTTKHH